MTFRESLLQCYCIEHTGNRSVDNRSVTRVIDALLDEVEEVSGNPTYHTTSKDELLSWARLIKNAVERVAPPAYR